MSLYTENDTQYDKRVLNNNLLYKSTPTVPKYISNIYFPKMFKMFCFRLFVFLYIKIQQFIFSISLYILYILYIQYISYILHILYISSVPSSRRRPPSSLCPSRRPPLRPFLRGYSDDLFFPAGPSPQAKHITNSCRFSGTNS